MLVSAFEKLDLSVQDFSRRFTITILHNYLGQKGDLQTSKSWLQKWLFAAPHQSAETKSDLKVFLKTVFFLIHYASFWNHSCGKFFCKIDSKKCFAKSLQTILISACWLYDSIQWGKTLKQLGVFWKTDPRWLPFVPFLFFQIFNANLHAKVWTNPSISF